MMIKPIPSFLAATRAADNLNKLSIRLYDLQRQTATGSVSQDFKGLGSNAGIVVSNQVRLAENDARMGAAQRLIGRFDLQDGALTQAADAATTLHEALSRAAAANRVGDLQESIQYAFAQTLSALNGYYAEQPMFSGERTDAAPVNLASLADLDAAPTVAGLFRESARDQVIDLGGGYLSQGSDRASTFATNLLQALKDANAAIAGIPVAQELTAAERGALLSAKTLLEQAQTDIINAQSRNGVRQKLLETGIERMTASNSRLDQQLGTLQDADLAQVAAEVSALQTQYQAAAKIFTQIREMSLVNFL